MAAPFEVEVSDDKEIWIVRLTAENKADALSRVIRRKLWAEWICESGGPFKFTVRSIKEVN